MHSEPSRPYATVNSGSAARLKIWLCASMIMPGILDGGSRTPIGGHSGVVGVGGLDRCVVALLVEVDHVGFDQATQVAPPPDLVREPVDALANRFGDPLLDAIFIDDRHSPALHKHPPPGHDRVDVLRLCSIDHHI